MRWPRVEEVNLLKVGNHRFTVREAVVRIGLTSYTPYVQLALETGRNRQLIFWSLTNQALKQFAELTNTYIWINGRKFKEGDRLGVLEKINFKTNVVVVETEFYGKRNHLTFEGFEFLGKDC